jgi:hypothetical protein
MQETIAQVLGLAMHANAFLRGQAIGDLWPDATFFGYCRSVAFLPGEPDPERPTAADPRAWLTSLAGRQSVRVRVTRRGLPGFSDRMSVGFVDGGSRWLIEENGGARPLAWSASWSFADRAIQDGRIWAVTYLGLAADSSRTEPPDLDGVEETVGRSLEAIGRFAERIDSSYAGTFRRALACLDGAEAFQSRYHPDLAPSGFLSRQAERILAACDSGWVFGGMGSWNDGAYCGVHAETGDALSDQLFDALQSGLTAVANSTIAALSPSPTSPSGR